MKIDEKNRLVICVPKKFLVTKLDIWDKNLTSMFFFTYCEIDKWRTFQYEKSMFRNSIIGLLDAYGKPFNFKTGVLSKYGEHIIHSLEFMEKEEMIKLVKGDYHNPLRQFVIEINKDNFLSGNYVRMPVCYYDFILESNASLKKENLLHVLLYTLVPVIKKTTTNPQTYEVETIYYQVYSESNKQTADKIGISEKTINKCLSVLSGRECDRKPLVFHRPNWAYDKFHGMPNIYTENTDGWQQRIRAELEYYENRNTNREKQSNENNISDDLSVFDNGLPDDELY